MSVAAVLLAPFLLMFPGAGERREDRTDEAARLETAEAPPLIEAERLEGFSPLLTVEAANQVRIEQHTTIRIAPRSAPPRPNMLISPPRRISQPRLVERRMSKCLPASRLAGVQVETGNRLILYLRDRRMVRAELERSCRARDFYSGFYLSTSEDGQLCVGRDTLLSRSGANCKLTRIRQLVVDDD